MGLKEKLASNSSGKPLIGTFFASELVDVAMTKADLFLYHGSEMNPFGGAELMKNIGQSETFALKVAISALLVGSYVLASIHEREISLLSQKIRPKQVTEKALQGGTIFMAGIISWDALNLGIDAISAIKF